MKRLLALSFAILMLIGALAACTTNVPEATETKDNATENSDVIDQTTAEPLNSWSEPEIIAGIPEDYDAQGVEIGIASRPEQQYIREFGVETQTDILDSKIFKRNTSLEKQINVKMLFLGADDLWTTDGIIQYVTTEFQSGITSKVDAAAIYGAYVNNAALRGYFVNLQGDDLIYMDLTKGYWNQDYVTHGTCFDQLYAVVGDFNLTVYDKSIVTFVNLDMARSNGIDPDTLYAAVDNKEWTADYMYNIVHAFSYMDNNDNKIVDFTDTVSVASLGGSECYDGFVRAWDLQMLATNDDGTHTIIVDGNAKLESAVDKMRTLYAEPSVYLDMSLENPFVNCFVAGNALFCIDILYRNAEYNTKLRNADFEYAILPLTMYDENQERYLTTPQDAYNAMAVMGHHPEKLEAVSATLELLASKSYDEVRPFYIEKMVKATYVSGAKSVKMLELALAGSSFDTAIIYYHQVGLLTYNMWRGVCNKEVTVAERWGAKREEIELAVAEFDSWFTSQKKN